MTQNESVKPRVEVVEETQETLEVLELDGTPRPQKMARESALLAGAHEVRFQERSFTPRHRASLDEVRAAVDALAPKRAEFPEVKPPAPLPPPPEPEPAPPQVPDALRRALEPVVGGALTRAEVLHAEETGDLVEAEFTAPDGRASRALFVVRDGEARPYDDIAARIDRLPTPALEEPPRVDDAPPAPAREETQPPREETRPKKALLGRFGRKGKDAAAPQPEPQPEAEPRAAPPAEPDAPAAKRSLLGRLGRKKDASGPAGEGGGDADAAAPAAEEPAPSKKRFGLRRK